MNFSPISATKSDLTSNTIAKPFEEGEAPSQYARAYLITSLVLAIVAMCVGLVGIHHAWFTATVGGLCIATGAVGTLGFTYALMNNIFKKKAKVQQEEPSPLVSETLNENLDPNFDLEAFLRGEM